LAGALLSACAFGSANAAGLIGTQVNPTIKAPSLSTTAQDFGIITVTGGNTFTINNFTTGLVIDDFGFTVSNLTPGAFFNPPFFGWVVTFLNGTTVQSASLLPGGSPAFVNGVNLSFTGTEVRINLAGSCNGCVGGESFRVAVSAVPEPSTWALFGVGLVALLGMRRRGATGQASHTPTGGSVAV
jgi:hypothetical protein